jgi:tetratricopeptide (TPR) repeat protein
VSPAEDRVEHLRVLRRYEDAEREARAALAADPGDAGVLAELAAVLLAADRHGEGLEAADAAVAAASERGWPHRLRALHLSELGRHDEAVAAAEVAVVLGPEDPLAALDHSTVLRAAGRLEAAGREALRAVRLAPEQPAAHLGVGLAASALDDLDTARYAYGEVLRLDPGNAAARNNLAALDMRVDRLGDAWRGLLDAGALDPTLDVVHRNVTTVLRRLCLRLALFLGGAALLAVLVTGYRSGAPTRVAGAAALLVGLAVAVWMARQLPGGTRPVAAETLRADPGLRWCYLGLAAGALLDLAAVVSGVRGLLVWTAIVALGVLTVRVTDGYGNG